MKVEWKAAAKAAQHLLDIPPTQLCRIVYSPFYSDWSVGDIIFCTADWAYNLTHGTRCLRTDTVVWVSALAEGDVVTITI